MDILSTIVTHKFNEVAARKSAVSVRELEQRENFNHPVISIRETLCKPGASGIIAEFKRKSPSKGMINDVAGVTETTMAYVAAGASALSILTDENFFHGKDEDLILAQKANVCPVLRKDFVVDEYQVLEAKSLGADVILLIAAVLEPPAILSLTTLAHSVGLEVLLEVHSEAELLANIKSGVDLLGVNNRNLKTFTFNKGISKQLAALIPDDMIKVSESGIDDVATVLELKEYGYQGFLMGQKFMEEKIPGDACRKFISELRKAT